jgi:hypothetical protein
MMLVLCGVALEWVAFLTLSLLLASFTEVVMGLFAFARLTSSRRIEGALSAGLIYI